VNRLSTRVIALSLGALGGSLLLVGAGTALALWLQAHEALDRSLLAAAASEARARPAEPWRAEQLTSDVAVHTWQAGDPLVDVEMARAALRDEQPRWITTREQRVLLVVAEPRDAPEGPDGATSDHPHVLLVASAPRVSIRGALGAFAVSYGLVALSTAGILGGLLVAGLRRALAPLEGAAARLDDLGGQALDVRVPTDGPDEVRRVLAATNGLLARLETAATTQRRFVADAAHELRTPVTRLLGELDLALRQPRDPEAYRRALEHGRRHAVGLRDLVEALLVLARIDAGQGRVEREEERLSAVALKSLAAERSALDEAGCTVSLEIGADPEFDVHVTLLRVAVANLLRNVAVHAAGAKVWLRTVDDGIEVEDDGPGIPEDAHERLTERFHRESHARAGLGLGLALVREVARSHGGDLLLSKGSRGGLRARIVLSSPSQLQRGS